MLDWISIAKTLGVFAARFAVFEASIGLIQPTGWVQYGDDDDDAALVQLGQADLGCFYQYYYVPPSLVEWGVVTTMAQRVRFVALLELLAACGILLVAPHNRLVGYMILSSNFAYVTKKHLACEDALFKISGLMAFFAHIKALQKFRV